MVVTILGLAALTIGGAQPSPQQAIVAQHWRSTSRSVPQGIHFRGDDPSGRRIAVKLLAKQITENEAGAAEASILRTAWIDIGGSRPLLLAMYGCSGDGNCDLVGFERSQANWRQVLDSIAQTCTILPTFHGGRRDLSASMHGSATESTIKTYWWRKNRYWRVSSRDVVFKR